MTEQTLLLIRGLPGSGKSTIAKEYVAMGWKHFEADMYFMRTGEYVFDATKLHQAHVWCQRKTQEALLTGHNVVVSNTFTTHKEMAEYKKIAQLENAKLEVLTATGNYNNVHNVPQEKLDQMKARWEE
jgi:predicted kinase